MPGSPPKRTTEPGTIPPPKTLFNSLPGAFTRLPSSKVISPISVAFEGGLLLDVLLCQACFSVDAEDKLFAVTRDMILTHNTEMAVKLFIPWGLALNQRAKFIHLSYSGKNKLCFHIYNIQNNQIPKTPKIALNA